LGCMNSMSRINGRFTTARPDREQLGVSRPP
jgi:hypothetical protein